MLTLQVFVTAQARTIELATCYVLQPASVMVTVPADVVQSLLERLNKYIFFGDQVQLNLLVGDVSGHTAF